MESLLANGHGLAIISSATGSINLVMIVGQIVAVLIGTLVVQGS